jgi:microcystin-dependent protein
MAEPFISQITLFGCNFAPRGWAMCDGQLLPISQNSALFSLLGTTFGGDGRTTLSLPDLRGRVPIHEGHGPGLNDYRLGAKGGTEYHTMTVNQMPVHNHSASLTSGSVTFQATTETGDSATPRANDYLATPSDLPGQDQPEHIYKAGPAPESLVNLGGVTTSGGVTVNNNGSSQAFSILNPYQVMNFCIALQGIFPSRS